MIRNKEAMPGEKSKLNLQSQSCRLRFAGHERDVRKTQAPGADQIPTRTAKAHNAAPLSERNVVPRMGDRQQQPARSRRVLQDDQNRSFGPTGPIWRAVQQAMLSTACSTSISSSTIASISRAIPAPHPPCPCSKAARSEAHTSELQSLQIHPDAVFSLKNKQNNSINNPQ